jgi:4-amino-4-deoxy-L-arabinose transferase-like glycosyltransferase
VHSHLRQERGPGHERLSARELRWLALVLVAQAALGVWSSLSKGLILDEFHTLSHARALSLRSFLEHARIDNHPPLAFALVALARSALGESEIALRLPALLCALGTTWLVARIARRARAAPVLSAALWGLGSAPLEFASQVRMYAPLALCVAGALEALLRFLDADRSRSTGAGLAVALWTALGLHAHYFFLHYISISALTLCLLAIRRPELRRALLALAPYLAIAAAIALPWYLWGFWHQLRTGLPPGSVRATTLDLIEAYVHLLFWNIRVAGPVPRALFLACGALAMVLAAVGFLRLVRAAPAESALPESPWLLAALAVGVPLWANLLVRVHPRLGFNWGYVLPSATAFAVLVAAGASTAAWSRVSSAMVLAGTATLSILNARAGGTEDYRGAVFSIAGKAGPSDCVLAVDWITGVFGRWLAWDYYAPRRALPEGLPRRLEITAEYDLAAPLPLCPRVFVLRRSIHDDLVLFLRLREAYGSERVTSHGYGVWVHAFEAPRSAGARSARDD